MRSSVRSWYQVMPRSRSALQGILPSWYQLSPSDPQARRRPALTAIAIRGGRLGPQAMAKEELKGIITAFKGGMHVQDSYVTVLEVERKGNRKALIGRKVVWQREDGLRRVRE